MQQVLNGNFVLVYGSPECPPNLGEAFLIVKASKRC